MQNKSALVQIGVAEAMQQAQFGRRSRPSAPEYYLSSRKKTMRQHDMVRDIFAITPDCLEYFNRREQTDYVISVLKMREPQLYQTVQLFYSQKLSLYEVAELLELSPTTVSRRLSRFRRLVKDRFPNSGELAPIYLTK